MVEGRQPRRVRHYLMQRRAQTALHARHLHKPIKMHRNFSEHRQAGWTMAPKTQAPSEDTGGCRVEFVHVFEAVKIRSVITLRDL